MSTLQHHRLLVHSAQSAAKEVLSQLACVADLSAVARVGVRSAGSGAHGVYCSSVDATSELIHE